LVSSFAMRIDIHAHTSDHPLWGLHVQRAAIPDLHLLARRYGVEKIVLMATYFPFKGSGLHNRELLERMGKDPLFLMFASLDVMNDLDGGLKELEELAAGDLISGIKLYPGYQDFHPSDRRVYPVYTLAARYGLPVMFHTGELHHCCPKQERDAGRGRCGTVCWVDKLQHLARPRQMERPVKDFPHARFILSHLGNPYFEELRELMAESRNVYTDISGQFLSASEEDTPNYREELRVEMCRFLELDRGIDRMLFGTDFPIQSYGDSVELVKALGLSGAEEAKIFRENARDLLGLRHGG